MKQKTKIWLVNYYAMPPELESRLRTIKFAHYLGEMGYNVTIIAASYMHNMNRNLIEDKSEYIFKKYDDLNFVHIRVRNYKGNGIARFFSLFQFHFKLYRYRNRFDKPDVIIHTALPPFGNILYFAAKKLKAKYIVEVLDLWPQSLVDLRVISNNNLLLPLLYKAEKWLYRKADEVVFSMEGGKDYIQERKWDTQNKGPIDLKRIHYINNGVDLFDFEKNKINFVINDPYLLNKDTKKIIYIGSIRLANNLKELIKAAEILKNHSDIKFLLYGDGDDRENLEEYCKNKNLKNVIFKDKWVNPKFVPFILSKSSVNVLNYMSNGFGKYGGSQSKLFQYMASGNPICSNLKMKYCPINKYNLGIAKEFQSDTEYAQALLYLTQLSSTNLIQMRERMKKVAKKYDYKNLTKSLSILIS